MWKKWRKLGDLWGLKYIFQQEGEACPHHFSASASKWKNSTYSLGKRNAQVYPDHQVNPAHHFSFFFPTGERKLTATGAGYNKNRQIFPPPFSLNRIAMFGSRASTQLYASLLPIHPEELISRFLMRGGGRKNREGQARRRSSRFHSSHTPTDNVYLDTSLRHCSYIKTTIYSLSIHNWL